MKKALIIIGIILMLFASYYAYTLGVIIVKVAIGFALLSIFGLGVWVGRLTKK